ncbi:hypothetical protein VPH35_107321 [Triticum aestivum]
MPRTPGWMPSGVATGRRTMMPTAPDADDNPLTCPVPPAPRRTSLAGTCRALRNPRLSWFSSLVTMLCVVRADECWCTPAGCSLHQAAYPRLPRVQHQYAAAQPP